jgi:hypothetical protein
MAYEDLIEYVSQNDEFKPKQAFLMLHTTAVKAQQRKKIKKLHLTPGNPFDDYILSSASLKMDEAAIHVAFEALQSSSSDDMNVKDTWSAWVDRLTADPKGMKRKVSQIQKIQNEDYKKSSKALTNATVNPVKPETTIDVIDLDKQVEEEKPKIVEQQVEEEKPENTEKTTDPFLAFKRRVGGNP